MSSPNFKTSFCVHGKNCTVQLRKNTLLQNCLLRRSAEGGGHWKSEDESPFDTDQLGTYNPDEHSITLFSKAIEAVSQMLGIQEDVLRSLTIIHCLSQFTIQCPADSLHQGWADGLKHLKEMLDRNGVDTRYIMLNYHVATPAYFQKCSKRFIVSAAQIQTYMIVRRNGEYLPTFLKVAAHQSRPYNRFRFLENSRIPKTTNALESFFGHLKENITLHRGMSYKHYQNYVKWYLYLRNMDNKKKRIPFLFIQCHQLFLATSFLSVPDNEPDKGDHGTKYSYDIGEALR